MTKRNKTGEPDFWAIARSYLHYDLAKVRKVSPKTIESYRLSLECYLRFLSEQHGIKLPKVSFDYFERAYLKGFLEWMAEKSYAEKTCTLRLSAVRSFLDYAAYEDIALVTLSKQAKTIKGPRIPKKKIEYLAREETTALISAVDIKTLKGHRNMMILIMLYDTGARVSELVDIRLSDLHLSKPAFVRLRGKGNKVRSVPLMDKTAAHLNAYLAKFHQGYPEHSSAEPLFYSNRDGKHRQLSTDTIALLLKQCAKKAKAQCPSMPDKVHCHLIRKTRAMDLYREGIPLPIIMQLLGHESMSTTSSFYAFATLDMVTEAIEKSNSLAPSEPPCWKTEDARSVIYSLK